MSKRTNKGRSIKEARHVRLYYWVMDTAAWQSLDPTARALYLDTLRRYNGSNNSRISFSVREAADQLRIGKTTASKAFAVLQDHGFIVPVRKGKFDRKTRHATEWRLTEFACDISGHLATKEFARWTAENSKAVSEGGLNGISARTIGTSERTAELKKAAYGT